MSAQSAAQTLHVVVCARVLSCEVVVIIMRVHVAYGVLVPVSKPVTCISELADKTLQLDGVSDRLPCTPYAQ